MRAKTVGRRARRGGSRTTDDNVACSRAHAVTSTAPVTTAIACAASIVGHGAAAGATPCSAPPALSVRCPSSCPPASTPRSTRGSEVRSHTSTKPPSTMASTTSSAAVPPEGAMPAPPCAATASAAVKTPADAPLKWATAGGGCGTVRIRVRLRARRAGPSGQRRFRRAGRRSRCAPPVAAPQAWTPPR